MASTKPDDSGHAGSGGAVGPLEQAACGPAPDVDDLRPLRSAAQHGAAGAVGAPEPALDLAVEAGQERPQGQRGPLWTGLPKPLLLLLSWDLASLAPRESPPRQPLEPAK